jgi:hypothetical protein
MKILRFQSKFEHEAIVNAAQFAQNYPKSAKICPKTISLRNFEIPPKIEILVFCLLLKFHA